MLDKIISTINSEEKKFIDLEGCDVWLNNSDNNEGECFEVWGVGINKFGVYGVCVGDNDFFAFDELDNEELEMIYELV